MFRAKLFDYYLFDAIYIFIFTFLVFSAIIIGILTAVFLLKIVDQKILFFKIK